MKKKTELWKVILDYQRYEKRCKLYNEDCVLNLLPQIKVVHRIVTIERIDIEE